MENPQEKRILFYFLVPTLALLFCCYLLEGLLQVFFKPIPALAAYLPMGNDIRGAKIKTVQLEYEHESHYNRYGFRDEEYELTPKPNEKMILYLGDSFAEGFGVKTEYRYSNLVTEALRKKDSTYTHRNAGQLATNPITYLDNLQRFGVALKPTVVVTSIFIGNDFQGAAGTSISDTPPVYEGVFTSEDQLVGVVGWVKLSYLRSLTTNFIGALKRKKPHLFPEATIAPKMSFVPRLKKTLVSDHFWDVYYKRKIDQKFFESSSSLSSEAFKKATSTMNSKLVDASFKGLVNPSLLLSGLAKKITPYSEADYIQTEKMIDAIDNILKARNIKHIVVLIPDISQVQGDSFLRMLKTDLQFEKLPESLTQVREFNTRLIHHFKSRGTTFIDGKEALKRAGQQTYHHYDQHLNPLGHQVIAREIVKALKISQD